MMSKSLEERIRVLEDVKEIREIMAKYAYTMDMGDWDGVLSCYAKECSADFGNFGGGKTRAELEYFYRKHLETQFATFVHRITNEIIEVKDDKNATGRWYLDEPNVLQTTKSAAWLAGTYYVDFVKEEEKWLIKRCVVRDWRFVTDYDKGWGREPFTVPGSRTPEDIAADQKRWERAHKLMESGGR